MRYHWYLSVAPPVAITRNVAGSPKKIVWLTGDWRMAGDWPVAGGTLQCAKPKAKEGSFESLKVGFRGKELAAVEIVDSFGQRSLLQFSQFKPNAATAADAFKFVVPKGADVVEQ